MNTRNGNSNVGAGRQGTGIETGKFLYGDQKKQEGTDSGAETRHEYCHWDRQGDTVLRDTVLDTGIARHRQDTGAGRHRQDTGAGRHRQDTGAGRHRQDAGAGRHRQDTGARRHRPEQEDG